MEATSLSEILMFYRNITRRHIPKDLDVNPQPVCFPPGQGLRNIKFYYFSTVYSNKTQGSN